MWDKVRKALYNVCEWLEIVMAGAVLIGLVIAAAALWPELVYLWKHMMEPGVFLEYLDKVFGVVIGIEFMKMLCRPNSANIIEALIFLIARHMIVQATTPAEDLLAVISIGILFFFRRYMMATKPDKNNHVPPLLGAIRASRRKREEDADGYEDDMEDGGEYEDE